VSCGLCDSSTPVSKGARSYSFSSGCILLVKIPMLNGFIVVGISFKEGIHPADDER
jgi:hypothetical protein